MLMAIIYLCCHCDTIVIKDNTKSMKSITLKKGRLLLCISQTFHPCPRIAPVNQATYYCDDLMIRDFEPMECTVNTRGIDSICKTIKLTNSQDNKIH